jgi:hypothetical protein
MFGPSLAAQKQAEPGELWIRFRQQDIAVDRTYVLESRCRSTIALTYIAACPRVGDEMPYLVGILILIGVFFVWGGAHILAAAEENPKPLLLGFALIGLAILLLLL